MAATAVSSGTDRTPPTTSTMTSLPRGSRKVSGIVLMCGILLVYVVVSTANFVSWFPETVDSTAAAGSLLAARLDEFSGKPLYHDDLPMPLGAAEIWRRKKQREIDEALSSQRNAVESTSTSTETTFPFSLQNRTQSPTFSIFYNVYFPPDQGDEGLKRSIEIVREQIGQIGSSYAASFENKPVTIFYNTIGKQATHNRTVFSNICIHHNVLCIHMQHFEHAFEEVTLQKMHDYCRYIPEQENPRLVYLHNKGSFHEKDGLANIQRRHLTSAALHEHCLNPPDASCNACGLVFYTVWSMLFPGNLFTTQCNHVRKLHAPVDFGPKMKRMFDLKRKKIKENPLYQDITPNSTGWAQIFGKGRFIPTHWVGSHPSLVPCDMSDKGLDYWYQEGPKPESDFGWGMIPRPTQKSYLSNMVLGNLFKMYELYGEGPPDDSWLWRSFPDGQRWKQVHAILGNRTVEETLGTERAKQVAGEAAA